MSSKHDVIIVGAGPAGSFTAFHLLEQGVENVLVVDKNTFPRDKLCGGGLTRRAQRELEGIGVLEDVLAHARQVPKTYIVTPSGKAFYEKIVPEKRPQMLVLNRRVLDDILMRRARERGAAVREGVEIAELLKENGRCRGVRTREGEDLLCDVLVMATGSHSPRLIPDDPNALQMVCLEGRYQGRQIEDETASLVFDEAFVPQYGWVFPEAENLFNVGVGVPKGKGSSKKARERLEVMLSKYLPLQVENAQPTSPTTGFPISTTYKVRGLVDGNMLYVGEAGRLVDPFTFEGISQAMISGRYAARPIASCLRSGETRHLLDYEAAVQKKFDHFSSMRWVGAIMKRRIGIRMLEAVISRKSKWRRAERSLAP